MSELWNIKFDPKDSDKVSAISNELQLNRLSSILLFNRGYTTPQEAREFLCISDNMLHDPFLLKDMDLAASTIKQSIDLGEKILVYGDYDVDGVTSTCILYKYLQKHGAKVSYHIPHRFEEGYGLNKSAIEDIAKDGVKLIITVDCGITAIDEVEYINSLGMKCVVTDHHECIEKLPRAIACVNAHRNDDDYPFKELCGAGVAFNLVCAIESLYQSDLSIKDVMLEMCSQYSDLVAIGTVADVMSLSDFNRYIVCEGLKLVENSANFGIKALRELNEYKVSSTYISFNIAPKLNAAGRISDASIALQILLSPDIDSARHGVEQLLELNKTRQEEETRIYKSAVELISQDESYSQDEVLVLAGQNWHAGVIGIVASRMLERFHKPTIMISISEDGTCRGSGRSQKGFNLVQAINECKSLLTACGGHELACGLSIEKDKIDEFRHAINEYAKDNIDYTQYSKKIDVECVISGRDISVLEIEDIAKLEPYGQGNPTPQFLICDAIIRDVSSVGQNKHTKLTLDSNGTSLIAMCFGKSFDTFEFAPGDKVDILCNLELNEFRGDISPKILVRKIVPAQSELDRIESQYQLYQKIKSGESFSRELNCVPDRGEFALVYRELNRLKKCCKNNTKLINISSLLDGENNICKTFFIFDIFSDVELVNSTYENKIVTFDLIEKSGKVNLDKSQLYNMIRKNQK